MLAAALAALALFALPAGAQALEQTVLAGDGAAGDALGYSVAIEGDTAVAGAPRDDGSKGAVYAFTRSGDSWENTAKLTGSDGAPDDRLGISVAIDGDTIVAGAFRDDVGTNVDQGSAYTFARTGAAVRTQTAKLTASDGAADDILGLSVAIDGDTIVARTSRRAPEPALQPRWGRQGLRTTGPHASDQLGGPVRALRGDSADPLGECRGAPCPL